MKSNENVTEELKLKKNRLISELKTICNAINNEYKQNGKSLHYKNLNIKRKNIKVEIAIINNKLILAIDRLGIFRFSAS
jgi:hypothetical protein